MGNLNQVIHFFVMKILVVVFIPGDAMDIDRAVAQELAPFNCEIEVKEYEEKCVCVGSQAQIEAHQHARKVGGTDQEIGERFEREHGASNQRRIALYHLSEKRSLTTAEEIELSQLVEKFDLTYAEANEPYNRALHDALEHHPLIGQPEADCEICGGIGKVMTTANPQAKWDYWSIGWHNFFDFSPRPNKTKARFLKRLVNWKNEIAEAAARLHPKDEDADAVTAVRDIPADWPSPYAAVADGKWYENYDSLSLPMKERAVANDEWETLYRVLLQTHRNCLAVACRVHI